MVDYLATIAKGKKLGLIVGVYNLYTIFDDRYYDNLPGGLLEAFGRGFGHNVKLYVYPAIDVETGELITLDNIQIATHLRGLVSYLKDNGKLDKIGEFDRALLHIMSDDVLMKIKASSPSWEDDVPYEVVKAIKFFELFGYQPKVSQ